MRIKPIVLTGGGTAGHITPLLAVAKEISLKNPEIPIVYIGQRNDINQSVISNSSTSINIYKIYAGKYRRYPNQSFVQRAFDFNKHLLNFRDGIFNIIGFLQSLFLIIKLRPKAVFMKGGFVGVPVCLAATIFRVKIVTHDSDVVPGLANRIIGRFSKVNAVATEADYPYPKSKVVVTGIPVRDEYYQYVGHRGQEKARMELDLPKQSKVLFIGGSTQGAKIIDDIVEKIVPNLLKQDKYLHIIQVFGRLNEHTLSTRYQNLEPGLKSRLYLHTFLHDNYRYMAAADVLVGRAGATFLAEAAVLSKACIIIPAPQLAGGHQIENAAAFEKQRAILVLEEHEINEENFLSGISSLLASTKKRQELGQNLNSMERADSAKKLATLLIG